MHSAERIELDPSRVFDYVLVVIPSRHKICGYRYHQDCTSHLSREEVLVVTRRFVMDGKCNADDIRIRSVDIAGKRVFAIWGYPAQVSQQIKFGLKFSASAKDRLSLFIIGACWI